MLLLYNLGIRIYYFAILLAYPFNPKARAWIMGRKGWEKKLKQDIQTSDTVIWFHVSSLGEFEQGRPIIEAWRQENPQYKILLTFFSPSGFNNINEYKGADYIHYLPLDTRRNAEKFLKIVKPRWAVFVKYELWYHLLRESNRSGARTILVSAIFRTGQIFFRFYGKWFRRVLYFFDHIFVQDENSVDLLMQLGGLNISLAGDTRFDRVAQIALQPRQNEKVSSFINNRFTFIFGSTWKKDEELIITYINSCKSDSCFIIAPHEIEKKHIQNLANRLHKRVALYSLSYGKSLSETRVLIIDNIGLLSSIYQYGNVAFIGGGFSKGIHNILEPAVFGLPVIFGPKYHKFSEANVLIREGGAFPVNSYEQFKAILDKLREDKEYLTATSDATEKFVQRNLGATQAILKYLKKS